MLQGLLVLSLLWWMWDGYAWLGSQAKADEGLVRTAMIAAMVAVFVVAVSIPEAWHDAPGGLDGPLVLVGAYLVVKVIHLSVYAVAARRDVALRKQVVITRVPTLADAVLLIAGALQGGWVQTELFAGALLVDWGGVHLTSRHGSWRIHSLAHWTERHNVFIILVIDESIIGRVRYRAVCPAAAGAPRRDVTTRDHETCRRRLFRWLYGVAAKAYVGRIPSESWREAEPGIRRGMTCRSTSSSAATRRTERGAC